MKPKSCESDTEAVLKLGRVFRMHVSLQPALSSFDGKGKAPVQCVCLLACLSYKVATTVITILLGTQNNKSNKKPIITKTHNVPQQHSPKHQHTILLGSSFLLSQPLWKDSYL